MEAGAPAERVVRPLARVEVLPHQGELLADVTSDVLPLVCGLGGGKTRGGVMKACQLAGINWPVPTGVFEPTYPMVRDILVPTFEEFFDSKGIGYRYNKNDHDMFFRMSGRVHHIMLRSTDNPDSLKGTNLGGIILDEAGLHDKDVWRHLPPRARHPAAKVRQFVPIGTPEGLDEFQEWAEGPWDEKKRGTRHTIRAETYDNTFLQPTPEEYVRTKLSHLDDTDIDQYVRGLFVARGTRVYRAFNRMDHGRTFVGLRDRRFVVGADFNFGKMVWPCAVQNGHEDLHVFGECVRRETTTEDMGEALTGYLQSRLYREDPHGHHTAAEVRRRTTIHVDPHSAEAKSVRAYKSDVETLRGMGFDVQKNREQIPIKDRVMTVNSRFRLNHLSVDVAECPELVSALEKQGRDKNGMPEKAKDAERDLSAAADALGYLVWGHPHWRATVPRGNLENRQPQGYR